MNRKLSANGKKIVIGLVAVLALILVFVFMKGCNKKTEPENKENTSDVTETAKPSENEKTEEENKEDESQTESHILENEGELEITLSEDEETYGE